MESFTAPLDGVVLTPADPEYADEIAAANTAVTHEPELVIGAASAADVVAAVRFARDNRMRVSVQGGGHGAHSPVLGGLLITTQRMQAITIDAVGRTATVAAGVIWAPVVAAAAEKGLAPVAGSSTQVGVVGYLSGGGLGPLIRSHGVSSDYVESFEVVTGEGELVNANSTENPDLFWALRGGKSGLGIVTEVVIRLVELPGLYAGALTFAEEHIETILRGWLDWTPNADPAVSTSVSVVNFPDIPALPPTLRGRRLLNLRFAYPGSTSRGEQLAAPLRALAPAATDHVGELAPADIATIHNDPTDPGPSWVSGGLLAHTDPEFASAFLAHFGAGGTSPFLAAELRHLGAAAAVDVSEGSAVGGRSGKFAIGLVGMPNPALFGEVLPQALAQLIEDFQRWLSPETTINFAGRPRSPEHYASAWPPEIFARLGRVRRTYDPDGVFTPFI